MFKLSPNLFNVNLKIYAKILAVGLQSVIPSSISLDQVGFVPTREARDNTIKILSLILSVTEDPCLLSLDAEKAFERLDWTFLKAILEQLGLPPVLIQNIMALYSCPSARVRVNGLLSEPVPISNETRQGCPLSPLLYILAMEHLATALQTNSSIGGVDNAGQAI